MPCFSPLTAYYSKVVGESGKRGITFDRNASFSGVAMKLPCGKCIGCRLETSRQWAMRCMHELRLHKEAMFLTLTYNDDNLPVNGSLVKRDLQLFHKRLRKQLGRFRYYSCGEYGDRSSRPHYHSIIFGLDVSDKRFYSRGKRGDTLYTSKCLDDIWQLGFVTVGAVTFDSCAYVARYVVDKITGDKSYEHYRRVAEDGSHVVIAPEFHLMSRKPGLGSGYFDKYRGEIEAHDSVVVNGVECSPPRYYNNKFDVKLLACLKVRRRKEAMKHREDNTPDRRRVRERVAWAQLNMKKRSV